MPRIRALVFIVQGTGIQSIHYWVKKDYNMFGQCMCVIITAVCLCKSYTFLIVIINKKENADLKILIFVIIR